MWIIQTGIEEQGVLMDSKILSKHNFYDLGIPFREKNKGKFSM